ncbi:hypothetical protein [Rhodovulum adriaticum]|uniref:Uncharacterized protein n=1 Tax=Rhodovulum adriaticum TaxID=35804 RepID=A0A4R2NYK1_RHOAD|nr:hypothetical protein [Rhodovulum adriaticum]TCP27369.1 hypothetical protein EV656_101275 [Rhodovulum adriaticum]
MRQHRTTAEPATQARSTTPMLRDFWNEMIATGLFEVSTGERFVEHMIDRIERRP